jgi:hypothetical protein
MGARAATQSPGLFAPYARVRLVPHRAASLALLFAACFCLVTLRKKVQQRATRTQERLAAILALALRSGALEFDGGSGAAVTSLWHGWTEPEESEEPEAAEPERMMSRYALLAYGGGGRDSTKPEMEPVWRQGAEDETTRLIRDEDLLLGIPRAFLRPESLERTDASGPGLAIGAGSAAGDNPGESIPQSHLYE